MAPSSPAEGVLSRRYRPLSLGLVLSVSVVAFDALAATTLMPSAVAEIDGLALYAWAFTGFYLGSLLGAALAGPLIDRRGPATALTAALAVFTVGLVLSAVSTAMWQLVAGRGLQGIGGGAVIALAYAMVGRAYPMALRPKVLAVISSAWVIPALVGPVVAAALAEAATWRAAFILPIPAVVAAVALAIPALRHVPAVDAVARRSGSVAAAVITTASVGVLLGGLLVGSVVVALLVAACAAPIVVLASRRLLPAGTYTLRRGIATGVAIRGLLPMAFFSAEALLALGVEELRGASSLVSGAAITAGALGWSAGAWLLVRIDRTPASRPVRLQAGAGLIAVGLALVGTVLLSDTIPIAVVALGWGAAGVGMGLAYPTTSAIVLDAAQPDQHGFLSSAMQSGEFLLVSIATGVSGAVIAAQEASGGHTAARAGVAVTFLFACTTALVLAAIARRTTTPAGAVSDDRPAPSTGTVAVAEA